MAGVAGRQVLDERQHVRVAAPALQQARGVGVVVESQFELLQAVVERLDIKLSLFELVVPHLKDGALLTTNTSGLPIRSIAEGRSTDFRQSFFGTHFFNPPRYMKLFELIPGVRAEVTFRATDERPVAIETTTDLEEGVPGVLLLDGLPLEMTRHDDERPGLLRATVDVAAGEAGQLGAERPPRAAPGQAAGEVIDEFGIEHSGTIAKAGVFVQRCAGATLCTNSVHKIGARWIWITTMVH